jgi:cytochrome c oxidase subunit 2
LGPIGTARAARAGRPRRILSGAALAALALTTATGCAVDYEGAGRWSNGGLPEGVTDQSERITTLWVGSWIVALAVGVLVWGLIIFAAIFHRRRRSDTGLPPQVRYNMPIEVLYTAIPIIMVAVYFFFTARDQTAIAATDREGADHRIEVVGKRWSWDFNYLDENVYETGTPGVPPTLVMPRGEKVYFELVSRDVIHSFWVVPFLYKQDVFPGRVNTFEVTAERNGVYAGKCAEFCGQDHSRMLFTVEVVDPEVYDERIAALRERGQVGRLGAGNGPTEVPPRSAETDPQEGSPESETGPGSAEDTGSES